MKEAFSGPTIVGARLSSGDLLLHGASLCIEVRERGDALAWLLAIPMPCTVP
jgi:hypothetical protein